MKYVNLFLLFFLLFLTTKAVTQDTYRIYEKHLISLRDNVECVESSYSQNMRGDSGKAIGPYQIWMICVNDVNKTYNTNFKSIDRWSKTKSNEIYYLYLLKGIKIYIKKNGYFPSNSDIYRMWNGGIYGGYKNPKTLIYLKKIDKCIKERNKKV